MAAEWARDTLITPSAANVLQLKQDFPVTGTALALGDVVLITCSVHDVVGTISRSATPTVLLQISSGASQLGLGNGNPSDHTEEGKLAGGSRQPWDGARDAPINTNTICCTPIAVLFVHCEHMTQ